MRRACVTLLFALMMLLRQEVFAQTPAPTIDNPRVTVWDVPAGARPVPAGMDALTVELAPRPGVVAFHPKGSAPATTGQRTVVIAFKDVTVPPLPNDSGYPVAFPRPRSITHVDNARVFVSEYTWNPGEPTPVHFHDKDVVVIYLDNGGLRSTTLDGVSVTNEYTLGTLRFNARDRVHSEVLASGRQRAILVELK